MSMHLEGPWLSKNGKKKGKVKYKSAEAKRQAEQLATEWEQIKRKHAKNSKSTGIMPTNSSTTKYSQSQTEDRPKSLNSWITGPVSSKPSQQYTGDNVKGIAVMHKSCLQPVFSQQEAIESANMRRG